MQRAWLPKAFGGLATLFLLVFLLYPLAVILGRSFERWDAVAAVASNPYYWGRLWFTVWQALLSTLLTVLLGLPGAVLFARYDFLGKRLLRSLFTLPFVMPTVVAAIGFLALVGPRGLLGVDLRGTLLLILLAHVFYNYAVVVRVVGSYLEAVGPRLFEAAQVLGAGPTRTFFRVTLPLAAPALVAAATLVFIFTFTSFGVILILAPEPRFATLEVEVYRLTSRLLDLSSAGLLALVQLVVITGFTLVYTRLQARLAVTLTGRRPLPAPTGVARLVLGLNLVVAFALNPVTPRGADLRHVLAGGRRLAECAQLSPPLLDAPRTVGFAGAGRATFNSLRFAAQSTALALVVGFAFAYAVVRGRLAGGSTASVCCRWRRAR